MLSFTGTSPFPSLLDLRLARLTLGPRVGGTLRGSIGYGNMNAQLFSDCRGNVDVVIDVHQRAALVS